MLFLVCGGWVAHIGWGGSCGGGGGARSGGGSQRSLPQFSLVCVALWSPDVSGVSGKLVEVWWWLLLVLRGVSPSQRSTVQKVCGGLLPWLLLLWSRWRLLDQWLLLDWRRVGGAAGGLLWWWWLACLSLSLLQHGQGSITHALPPRDFAHRGIKCGDDSLAPEVRVTGRPPQAP